MRTLVQKQSEPMELGQPLRFHFIHKHTTHTTNARCPDVMGLHYAPDAVRIVEVRTGKVRAAGPAKEGPKAKARKRAIPTEEAVNEEMAEAKIEKKVEGEVEAPAALGDPKRRYARNGCRQCRQRHAERKPLSGRGRGRGRG